MEVRSLFGPVAGFSLVGSIGSCCALESLVAANVLSTAATWAIALRRVRVIGIDSFCLLALAVDTSEHAETLCSRTYFDRHECRAGAILLRTEVNNECRMRKVIAIKPRGRLSTAHDGCLTGMDLRT